MNEEVVEAVANEVEYVVEFLVERGWTGLPDGVTRREVERASIDALQDGSFINEVVRRVNLNRRKGATA